MAKKKTTTRPQASQPEPLYSTEPIATIESDVPLISETQPMVTTIDDTPAGLATSDPDIQADIETDRQEEMLLLDATKYHGITEDEVFAYRIDLQARAVTLVTVDARKLFYPPL
jgi:hypothetical protein